MLDAKSLTLDASLWFVNISKVHPNPQFLIPSQLLNPSSNQPINFPNPHFTSASFSLIKYAFIKPSSSPSITG